MGLNAGKGVVVAGLSFFDMGRLAAENKGRRPVMTLSIRRTCGRLRLLTLRCLTRSAAKPCIPTLQVGTRKDRRAFSRIAYGESLALPLRKPGMPSYSMAKLYFRSDQIFGKRTIRQSRIGLRFWQKN